MKAYYFNYQRIENHCICYQKSGYIIADTHQEALGLGLDSEPKSLIGDWEIIEASGDDDKGVYAEQQLTQERGDSSDWISYK